MTDVLERPAVKPAPPEMMECPDCKGFGATSHVVQCGGLIGCLADDMCERCDGTGEVPYESDEDEEN